MNNAHETPNGGLLEAAASGDREAWDALVDRYASLLWDITRSYRLSPADAADVVQATWLRLVENLDRIADPGRLAGWLSTTARLESLRLSQRSGLPRPGDDVAIIPDDEAAPVEPLLPGQQDAPRTPADKMLGSLFAAAEQARLSHEPAHDEAATLRQFNAWLDANTKSPTVMPQQPRRFPQEESGQPTDEQDAAFRALGTLPEAFQRLLRLLAVDPPLSYLEITDTFWTSRSAALAQPGNGACSIYAGLRTWPRARDEDTAPRRCLRSGPGTR